MFINYGTISKMRSHDVFSQFKTSRSHSYCRKAVSGMLECFLIA